MASRMRPMSNWPPMVFFTPISTLSKSMNTAIRVVLVVVVGMFTCYFRRAIISAGALRRLLPGSMFREPCSEVVGLQEPGRGIEPPKYSVPGRSDPGLRIAGERLRIFDFVGNHASELAALEQLSTLATSAGHFIFRGADRLLAASARLHAQQVAVAGRRDEAEHAVVLPRQLDQDDALARPREVIHLVGAAEERPRVRGRGDDDFVAGHAGDADHLDALARPREPAAGTRARLHERLEAEPEAVAVARDRNRVHGRNRVRRTASPRRRRRDVAGRAQVEAERRADPLAVL